VENRPILLHCLGLSCSECWNPGHLSESIIDLQVGQVILTAILDPDQDGGVLPPVNKLRSFQKEVDLRGDHADIDACVVGMDIALAILGAGLGQEPGVILDQQNAIQLQLLLRGEKTGGCELARTGDANIGELILANVCGQASVAYRLSCQSGRSID